MPVSESFRTNKTHDFITGKLASNHDQTLPLQPLEEVENTAKQNKVNYITTLNSWIIRTKRNLKQHMIMKTFENLDIPTKQRLVLTKNGNDKRKQRQDCPL